MSAQPVNVSLSDELDKLGPAPEGEPGRDAQPEPAPKRRSRSGTSGAERARRAKAGGAHTGADAQPRRTTRTTKPKIAEGMATLYSMAGVGLSVVPNAPAQAVGLSLVSESANIGKAWEKAASEDPRIREALERLLAVSTLGQIIAAHMPVILAGLVAGGVLPAAMIGGLAPAAGGGTPA